MCATFKKATESRNPSTYTGQPIPQDIAKELEKKFGVDSLEDLVKEKFKNALEEINKTVLKKYRENSRYADFFKPNRDKIFIEEKSLRGYFKKENIRKDKLNVLKCFLDYLPEKLDAEGPRDNSTDQDSMQASFIGAWYSYIYDEGESSDNKVKRTVMFITHRNSYFMDVQYESLRGRFTGTAEILNNSVLFNIQSGDKKVRIFLCAELPEFNTLKTGKDLILNVSCLSNSLSGRPVTSNVIMVKNLEAKIEITDMASIELYLETKPTILSYTILREQDLNSENSSTIPPEQVERNTNEREIVSYLFRNKTRNGRLEAFSPNTFSQVAIRNSISFRKSGLENYERLKMKLAGHIFYAFNRFRQNIYEVAIFAYSFKFIDEEKRCIASRHPINDVSLIEFLGEAHLEAEMLYIIMRDDIGQRRKQYIARFNTMTIDNSNVFVFKGITSSISSLNKNPMALRELIVGINMTNAEQMKVSYFTDVEKANGLISYDRFRELPDTLLKTEEKLFLANQSMSILTFPSKNDNSFIYYRLDKARKYNGLYQVFIFAQEESVETLHMTFNIDSLSEVTLKMQYGRNKISDDNKSNVSEAYLYHGICEFYNNSLRISVHFSSNFPNDEKHSEFIFDPIVEQNRQPPALLTGVNLTTGDQNKAAAYSFLAIQDDWWKNKGKKLFSSVNSKDGHNGLKDIGTVNYEELKILHSFLEENSMSTPELSKYLRLDIKRSALASAGNK